MPALAEYRRKRRFADTPEPAGKATHKGEKVFVIQKHAATRLHYDLRLEVGGVLKSWAVPKGLSLNPADKRLAIQVEDHPFEYRKFEGTIPDGNYGAGEVIIWDQGTYEPEGTASTAEQIERGELKFRLHGHKLNGSFVLVRLRRSSGKPEWLVIKHKDSDADQMWNIEEHNESVVSDRHLGNKNRKGLATEKKLAREKTAPSPAQLPGAQSAPMPSEVSVTLAKLGDKSFSDPNWLFEIKWDGIRTIALIDNGKVRLFARSKRNVTAEFPEFGDLAKHVRTGTAILDGEIVTLDENGRSNFQKLQNRFGVSNPSPKLIQSVPLTYYVFDLLYCNGFDLRKSPLLRRKELLRDVLVADQRVRYSEHQLEKGKELFEAAKEQRLEGIVGKQIESPYTGNRTPLWIKLKVLNELNAAILGWTAPRRTRQYFGALVLGLYDQKELKFIGSVGTGFDQKTQKTILAQLEKLKVQRSPLREPPRLREKIEWVRPALVTRIKFANWTDDDHLRAPVYLSISKDRSPQDCTFSSERPVHISHQQTPPAPAKAAKSKPSNGSPLASSDAEEIADGKSEALRLEIDGRTLNFTNLNKIYFPDSNVRKRDLIAYYYRMADYILPFLKNRPLVMRRYPNGIEQKSFFQKEAPDSIPDWLPKAVVYSDERGGDMEYVMANDRPALLFLTNLGCIDHNPWSSRADAQDHPDYVFFDLDPTPTTSFSTVLRVARSIYNVLRSAKLICFMKTSGATGFHIFVPLEPIYKYEQIRTFAEIIGQLVAAELPMDTTVERSVRKRPGGRVLLDALQNARGKPLACVYSVRAHPGATVSTPVTADEILSGKIDPNAWNIRTLEQRLSKVGDLWKEFWNKRQTLDKALAVLSKQLTGGKPRTQKR